MRSPRPSTTLPADPAWAAEPFVTPKLAPLPEQVVEIVPPPIPNWDRASVSTFWPDARWEHASRASRSWQPVAPVAETHRRPERRSRAFTTTVVLASLFVVFIAVTVVMVLLHHSTKATARTASTTAVISPDSARLQTATQAIDVDTNTARLTLHTLSGIPTPPQVAAQLTPYISSLRHYQTVLSGAEVPAAARRAAATVRTLVSRDARFLGTIQGLAPLRLGSYLEEFGTTSTQFQKDLGTLERALGAPTS